MTWGTTVLVIYLDSSTHSLNDFKTCHFPYDCPFVIKQYLRNNNVYCYFGETVTEYAKVLAVHLWVLTYCVEKFFL